MNRLQTKNHFAQPITKLAFMLLLSGAIASCSDASQENAENTMDTMTSKVEQQVDQVQENIQEYRDEDFVTDVIKSNNEELHLLALGKTKGTNKDLKGHAKMMETDHKKMGEAMAAYATKKNFTLKDNGDMKDGLDDKAAGAEWDKDWADKMVDEHEKVVKKFENAESRSTDAELKEMITATLPTLRSHLTMAQELKAQLDK